MTHNYLCECADKRCRETFTMSVSMYERGIADGYRFVRPGHQRIGERVVRVSAEVNKIDDRRR